MSKFLTIPVADGNSLTHAALHNSNQLSGLTAGTNYVCYALAAPSESFTATGEPLTVPDPETLPEGSATVQVVVGAEAYELTVPAGTATLAINGAIYAFDTADIIGKAPVILAPAAAGPVVRDTTDTVTYRTAPFLYDPAGGVPVVTLRTVRDGEVLASGDSYAIKAHDRIAGFSVRQEVVNAYGVQMSDTEILPPLPYTESLLPFSGNVALIKSDGIQTGGASNVLVVANMVLNARSGYIFRCGTNGLRAYFQTNSFGRLFAGNTAGSLIYNFVSWYSDTEALTPGDRVCLLLYVKSTGYAQIATYRNGQVITASTRKATNLTPKLSVADSLSFGYRSSTEKAISGGYYDMRIWADIPADVDITSAAGVGQFIDAAGVAKHPMIANSLHGQPRVWLPGTVAEANALVNLGNGGAFTSKTGTFA